jgi:predicted peptidase
MVTICLTVAVVSFVPVDVTAITRPLEYRHGDKSYRYRLYVPELTDSDAKLPIIVWFHGLNAVGDDNTGQLEWLDQFVFNGKFSPARFPFFLLAPQCPISNAEWVKPESNNSFDMIDVTAEILKQTIRGYPIDEQRVYAIGLSSGGLACWYFGARYPHLVAGLAPLGAGRPDIDRLEVLKDVPIWAFHGLNDQAVPIRFVRQTVAALQGSGGTVALTEIPSRQAKKAVFESHDCWTAAFEDYHLLTWLLAQRRGEPGRCPPGTIAWFDQLTDAFRGWTLWQLVAETAIIGVLLAMHYDLAKQLLRKTRALKSFT